MNDYNVSVDDILTVINLKLDTLRKCSADENTSFQASLEFDFAYDNLMDVKKFIVKGMHKDEE